MKNNRKGFTIVELVIVIAVIGILAGVLIPTFSGITQRANESAALQQAKNGLQSILPLTGGSLTPDSLFFVNNDKDEASEFVFKFADQTLKTDETLVDANGDANPVDVVSKKYAIYVSKDIVNGNAITSTKAGMVKDIFGIAGDADIALTTANGVTTFECGEEGTETTVEVYYTTDIKDTLVVVIPVA